MISSNRALPCTFVKLSNRQKHAVPLVLAARSIEEGCRAAGIAKRTWYNWMRDEALKEAVSLYREQVISDALERLKSAVAFAVEEYARASNMRPPPEGPRLQAHEVSLPLVPSASM